MSIRNWGIIGPGRIAAKFSAALDLVPGAVKYAVASRDNERAGQFAARHRFIKSYGSYREMVEDPDLDVVYIATPHSHHLEHTLLALNAGKHVLCEKAFSVNSSEVEQMIALAKERSLFLMEALWPPFQPSYRKADELVGSGLFGSILHIRSKFSFNSPFDPKARTWDPLLAGGSLLDVGIYPVMDSLRYLGMPESVSAVASFASTGVDSSVTALCKYENGSTAELHGSFLCDDGISTEIIMEKGRVVLSRGRGKGQTIGFGMYGSEMETISWPEVINGFEYEIEEVMNCLAEGRMESNVVSHQFSLMLINLLDEIRNKAGIVYQGR